MKEEANMPSIESTRAADLHRMPTPASLERGAKSITAQKVGPAAISKIGHPGFSDVESAQITAEQSYSAMAAATSGGGTDITLEHMLQQNGKSLG